MQRDWVIIQDTREKKPLVFPHHITLLDDTKDPLSLKTCVSTLETVRQKMDAGDYTLQGFEDRMLVERKGSIREVATNCLDRRDRTRFLAATQRLIDSCSRPILLLEGSPSQLFKAKLDVPVEAAVDALIRVLVAYKIELLLLPTSSSAQRRACGEWVARLLISGAVTNGSIPQHNADE